MNCGMMRNVQYVIKHITFLDQDIVLYVSLVNFQDLIYDLNVAGYETSNSCQHQTHAEFECVWFEFATKKIKQEFLNKVKQEHSILTNGSMKKENYSIDQFVSLMKNEFGLLFK
jgi:hypothetical protein